MNILRCRNGDFNVKVTDSELGVMNLMYVHTEAPNKVEVVNTTMGTLYLTPSSPPAYQFDSVTLLEGFKPPYSPAACVSASGATSPRTRGRG